MRRINLIFIIFFNHITLIQLYINFKQSLGEYIFYVRRWKKNEKKSLVFIFPVFRGMFLCVFLYLPNDVVGSMWIMRRIQRSHLISLCKHSWYFSKQPKTLLSNVFFYLFHYYDYKRARNNTHLYMQQTHTSTQIRT